MIIGMASRGLTLIIALLTLSAIGEAWYVVNQQRQIDQMNSRITSLHYQNTVFSTRCNALETNISAVLGELETEIDESQREYETLEEEYMSVKGENERLEYTLEKLGYDHGELQSEFHLFSAGYAELREEVNSRVGLDGNLSRFIRPQDTEIIELMLEITGGLEDPDSRDEFWADTTALYEWVSGSIGDTVDTLYPFLYNDPWDAPRWLRHSVMYPDETLSDGMGDCEDQAILLLSMIAALDDRHPKWCISLDWEGGGHVAVAIPVSGGKLAILDPTIGYTSGDGSESSAEPVDAAIENWADLWSRHGVRVDSVFNDEMFVAFDSTDEFLSWFQDEYDH